MKKFLALASVFLFLFAATGFVTAAENLDGWSEYVDSGTALFTPNGEKLALFLEDDPAKKTAWAKWYKNFPGAYGVLATFKVNSFTGSDSSVGLRKYVGLTNAGPFSGVTGNPILAEIYLAIYNNEYRVYYKVRERTTNYDTVKYLAKGALGDWDGTWKLGDQVTLGMAVVGQDIYFYTPNVEAFTKVQLLDGMSPLTDKWSDIEVVGSIWQTDGSVSAEVSDLKVLQ